MKKILAVVLSVLMALTCCATAFAAEKTIDNPANAYAPYDAAAVAAGNTADLSYDQVAGIILDWLDRRIADEAADFNAFTASVGVDLSINGVDDLVAMKDHVAELGGDFANLNTDAIVTRQGGDVNFFYGIFQFMADNADTFGKVFRWDDQVFDYGKVGEYIETLEDGDPIKTFYEDYLVTGNIQEKFVAEIAREMGYTIPKNGEDRAETFDLTISNGVKDCFLKLFGDALSADSKAAVKAMDLRTTDVYTLVKEFVGLLQNDYKDQLDDLLEGFLKALQGMVKVIEAGVNVEPPVLTVGHENNETYATYHPASAEMADYMPTIYANDKAKDAMDQYADEDLGIEVKKNSEMTPADKALVAGAAEAWGKYFKTKATFNEEELMNLNIKLSDVEDAVIAYLQDYVNGKGGSVEAMGTTVAFNVSDAQATFSYKAYKDEDSFAVQVKVESATAKVNITSPIEATVTANLLDPDATVVNLGGVYSFANSLVQPMVVSTIKTAIGDMLADPAFVTVVMNNLNGEIEELNQIKALVSYIDANAAYDETLLDVMAGYDRYKGAVGQVNHILYKAVDMIASDEGMAYLGIEDGDNSLLYANLQKICDKVSGLLDTMKQYIDRDNFVALADQADISAVFASSHGFNAGMIYDMDFSGVENALDCGIRVACDLLAEDDPDSIFYDFHMRVENLETLDAIAAAAADMVLGKVMNAIDLEGWAYTYAPIDYANVKEDGAEDAIMGKIVDILYYAATYATDKINAAANELIGKANDDFDLGLGAVAFQLNVKKSANWQTTLNALTDRFIGLTNGLLIASGNADGMKDVWGKINLIANAVLPMNSMFSNYTSVSAVRSAFYDKALDGDLGDFLALFEVKEDAIAGGVPVTYALINASDYIVDAFFPDTVEAQLYTASETVQEEFTGSASDQGIAARNMVSINNRRTHLLPALLDLVKESGLLADFACDHANTEAIPAVAATCTAAGKTEGLKCADCGKIITAQEEIPALGHADDNNDGVCDRCETNLNPDEGSQDNNGGKTGIAGVWQKIVDFFQKIVNFFKNLFKRG